MDVGNHHVRVDHETDSWRCACSAGGRGTPEVPAEKASIEHWVAESVWLLERMPAEQLAGLLRAGAYGHDGDHDRVAAVELLIAHGFWLESSQLRSSMQLQWARDGSCTAYIDWIAVKPRLGYARRALRHLARAGACGVLAGVTRWVAGDEPNQSQLFASGPQIAVLRVAASLVCGYPISLSEDLASLGPANRGRVLTAIGHMLSDGGAKALQVRPVWVPRGFDE